MFTHLLSSKRFLSENLDQKLDNAKAMGDEDNHEILQNCDFIYIFATTHVEDGFDEVHTFLLV